LLEISAATVIDSVQVSYSGYAIEE